MAPGTPGALPAVADAIEELGASRVVHADLDGVPFAVALTDAVDLKPGDPVGIVIDKMHVHLYAADNGRRIVAPLADKTG